MSPGKVGDALAVPGDARKARTKKETKQRVCTTEEWG
jgi:hypothetical protein